MSRFCSDVLGHLRPVFKKVIKFSKSLFGNHSKPLIFQSFIAFLMIGSLLCFFIVVGSSYFYMFPSAQSIADNNHNLRNNRSKSIDVKIKSCNLFDGKWVIDETYNPPLYNASQCPFAESGFDCLSNGRRDKGYLKWRWKPRDCEIPKLDVKKSLEFLRGKRVVFVGDSLSRTQWESMICMLMSGVEDKRSVFEVNGNEITKRIRHLKVRFDTFDLTIEFYRSIFLVQPVSPPKRSPKRVKTTVKLDQIDDVSGEWSDSDVLVFNSGHWWTPTKLYEMGWYFQIGGRLKLGFPIRNAFKAALVTWKTWIENSVNPNRTRVFFRTFESTHWSSGSRQNCKVTRRPLTNVRGKQTNWISDEIVNAVSNVSIHVEPLHVTRMGGFRSDSHVGSWSDNPSVPDCSHWCLPGVPDVWNEILFYYLLSR